MQASSDASPFAGTAPFYDRFRAPYAQAAIDVIVEHYNLGEGVRALDLGCGPGTIAIPLSYTVREVVAVDPDADMIAEGRRLAASRGRQNIQWLRSRAEDVSLGAEPFRVTTIGHAFHWMDRDEVLRKHAIFTADGGGLALADRWGHTTVLSQGDSIIEEAALLCAAFVITAAGGEMRCRGQCERRS